MRTGIVAFLAGILLLTRLPELPSLYWLFLFPPVFILAVSCARLRLPACFLCGFLWVLLHAGIVLSYGLDKNLEGETMLLEGRVASLVEHRVPGVRFEFEVTQLRFGNQVQSSIPGKVLLNWYRDVPELLPGEKWQLAARLKRPHGFINPGGFDYERWLFQQRLLATGYVVASGKNERLGQAPGLSVNAFRQSLRDNITKALDDHPLRTLITALSLGDRSGIDASQRRILIDTGTSHLLAISGLHVGLVAGLVFFITRRSWGCLGPLALHVAAPRVAAATAILTALMYALLAGFAVPTQRALVMLAVVMGSFISSRRYAFSHVLTVALLLVLLLDPLAVLAPGFWLSFGAIAVIAYGILYRQDTTGFWWRWGRTQYLVAVGLLPLLLLWFQRYPLYGMAANMVAIPWVSMLIVPLSLLGTLCSVFHEGASVFLLNLAAELLAVLWPALDWLANLEMVAWQVPAPAIPALVAAIAGVVLLLSPAGIPGRWLGIICLLPLFFPKPHGPERGELWFTLLDVGQGLSAVVQTANHSLIYDTGARFSRRFNAGEAVVVPYLRYAGISMPDRLIVSHGDNDHIGGAQSILSTFRVRHVSASEDFPRRLPGAGLCRRGQEWQWDGVSFRILHPGDERHYSRNNRSCVLKVESAGRSVLLTGDIEHAAEEELVKLYGGQLAATVLVVPHHGSKTSSGKEFLDTVSPEMALIPAGYRNRFSLPNQDILRRYASRDIDMYNTAIHGAITVKIGNDGLSLSTYRQRAKRFWHNGP